MNLPKSIYERCVLHDIFNEITCLETFRLSTHILKIYDYGVTSSDYVIVMKKYAGSVKEWRAKNGELGKQLSLYREVLQAVHMLHGNNVTHYDIKADNILLDEKGSVVLADFGECKMFTSEEDEYCTRSRGTEYIKSPEMLTLTIHTKKEGDGYDRRKKVGTTRASDIWSLGCLLFELLTGQFLFFEQEWAQFYIRVTSPNETLLTEEKLSLLGDNVYIVDFLKYILVRDPKHRPNIESVLKRFEHVYALLVTNQQNPTTYLKSSFDTVLDRFHTAVYTPDHLHSTSKPDHPTPPDFLKLFQELYICNTHYFLQNKEHLIQIGITNIVSDTYVILPECLSRFQYFLFSVQKITQMSCTSKAVQIIPHLLDYFKQVFLHRGKILIIENEHGCLF